MKNDAMQHCHKLVHLIAYFNWYNILNSKPINIIQQSIA